MVFMGWWNQQNQKGNPWDILKSAANFELPKPVSLYPITHKFQKRQINMLKNILKKEIKNVLFNFWICELLCVFDE